MCRKPFQTTYAALSTCIRWINTIWSISSRCPTWSKNLQKNLVWSTSLHAISTTATRSYDFTPSRSRRSSSSRLMDSFCWEVSYVKPLMLLCNFTCHCVYSIDRAPPQRSPVAWWNSPPCINRWHSAFDDTSCLRLLCWTQPQVTPVEVRPV